MSSGTFLIRTSPRQSSLVPRHSPPRSRPLCPRHPRRRHTRKSHQYKAPRRFGGSPRLTSQTMEDGSLHLEHRCVGEVSCRLAVGKWTSNDTAVHTGEVLEKYPALVLLRVAGDAHHCQSALCGEDLVEVRAQRWSTTSRRSRTRYPLA